MLSPLRLPVPESWEGASRRYGSLRLQDDRDRRHEGGAVLKLRIMPHQPAYFDEYARWCQERGRVPNMTFTRASAYIWIQAEEIGLVLGVGLFDSPAFILAEELVTRPGVPCSLAHSAVSLAVNAFVSYCALACKYPVVHPQSRGVAKVLARKGFVQRPCITMSREPYVQVAVAEKAKPEPKKRKGRTGRRGPARKKA